MANSSTVSSGDLATATQYNNLRSDVIDTSTGHVHDGTNGRGDAQTILQVSGTPLVVENSTDAASNQVAIFRSERGASSATDNDEIYVSFNLDDDGGNSHEFARITAIASDVSNASEDGALVFYVADTDNSGDLQEAFRIAASTGGTVTQTFASNTFTFGSGADTDIALNFNANSADGVITWMEDEDYFQFSDDILMNGTEKIAFNDTGEYISGDGTDLTIGSGADINLTATSDINIPADVGLTFGNDAEKIEGDGTDLTIAGNNINLTATADVVVPANVGITFGSGEKIEGDSTDLTITSGAKINLTATSDVVVPANVGITFGSGEKIEGDNTDLTITSGAKINLTATSDVVIPANIGLTFGTGEKIEGDSTDLTVTSGADINLTATGDVNMPANVGITFGDDAEKIEGDGTDLTISGNNINLTAAADVVVPANIGITFGSGEKIEGDNTNLTVTSGADINLTATSDINVPADVGITFGDDAEKIEGDGTDLTISGNNINLTAAADVLIPADIGLFFGNGESIEGDNTDLTVTSGAKLNLTATSDVHIPKNVGIVFDDNASEKIESNNTDLTINSGADINLTATTDVNIPANVGITFGDDAEKIEGDGTDLTITGNNINLTATADVVIPANVGITFGSGEKIEGDSTDLTITSGADIALTATADVNLPANVGLTFGNDGEKIEGDGSDLTISGNSIKIAGNLVPNADDTYDLGSASAAWQDLFLEGDLTMTDAGTVATSAGALTVTSAAAATWSTAAGILTIDGDDGILLKQSGSGGLDIAGYAAVGSGDGGAGLFSKHTFIVDRNHTVNAGGSQLFVKGDMTIDGGTNEYAQIYAGSDSGYNTSFVINSGGVHPYISTAAFYEPNITETSGSVTNAVVMQLVDAPTEGTNNYSLWCRQVSGRANYARFDSGTIIGNTTSTNALIDDSSTGSGTVTLYIGTNTIDVTDPSDSILKENIEDTSIDSLSILDQLQLRDFNWKSDNDNYGHRTERQFGMVAQEVEEVLPHLVRQDEDGIRNVQYNRMIPYLVKAIQELNAELQELKGGN